MAVLIRFPKVGPGVEQATVGQWRKKVGDAVAEGEALVEIITDKATFDLESEADGVLLAITAPEKSTIPVNYILAAVGEPGEAVPDVSAENERIVSQQMRTGGTAGWVGPGQAGKRPGGRLRATPSARRLARREGIALEDVTSNQGVIKEEHVREYLRLRGTGSQTGR